MIWAPRGTCPTGLGWGRKGADSWAKTGPPTGAQSGAMRAGSAAARAAMRSSKRALWFFIVLCVLSFELCASRKRQWSLAFAGPRE